MTPEQARELLRGDFASEVRERMVGNLEAGFTRFDGAHIEGTPGDFALTEAAPALAEQIASQHYEYDYEVVFGDEWTPQGYEFVTLEDAQRRVAERRRRTPARIIRRLVSEWEVVE